MFGLIDRIVSLDMGQRGMRQLYKAARALYDEPICVKAARQLTGLKQADHVMIITGSIVRGWVSLDLAETDGPLGTAALARAINHGFRAIPVVLTDPSLLKCIGATMHEAGLTVVDQAHAMAGVTNPRLSSVVVMDTCSDEPAKAQREAKALLDKYKPRVIISAERAGMSSDGTFRNSLAQDYSAGRSLLDYVVREGQARGVPTIGVGDFGNEIGMGSIRETVEKYVDNGKVVCADLGTDVVFPAGVSNWGCYAILAALAILTGRRELAHTAELEKRLLEAAPRLGLVDGLHGSREATADGMPGYVSVGIASLLEAVVDRGIAFQKVIGAKAPMYDIDQLSMYRRLM